MATTSKIVRLFVQDTTQTDGRGLTGLVFNSAGLTAYFIKEGDASPTAITLVTATVGTWVSGGFVQISAANMPGWYELHLPNAAIASGRSCGVMLKGAANMVQCVLEIELEATDNQDAVRYGLSALPNVAAGANGGLPLGDASGRTTVGALAAGSITAAAIATDAIDADALAADAVTEIRSGVRTELGVELGRLDVAVSTRNGTAPDNATIATIGATVAATLDAAVSSRLAGAGYTAPPSAATVAAAVWASGTRTLTSLSALAADLAAAVWNAVASAFNTAGSMGEQLNAASSAGDPWATALPGAYAAGQAGQIVGDRLDVAVSTRLADADYSAPPASVLLDLSQDIPDGQVQGSVGDALLAAEAQGGGRWTISGTTLTVYRRDGVTPYRVFTLDSATAPTSRT